MQLVGRALPVRLHSLPDGDSLSPADDPVWEGHGGHPQERMMRSTAVRHVQAGAARTGISEMGVLATATREDGRPLIPWGWAHTAISAFANLHFSVVHEKVPFVEYAPPDLCDGMMLRTELSGTEPLVRDGRFAVPPTPGLGVEIDPSVLARFRVR